MTAIPASPEQDVHDDLRAGKKQPRKEFKLVDVKFPETLIKSQSTSKLYWDFLVIIFSVYQAVTIPIQLSFDPDDLRMPLPATLDSIITLVFIMDIFIRLRTTHIHP